MVSLLRISRQPSIESLFAEIPPMIKTLSLAAAVLLCGIASVNAQTIVFDNTMGVGIDNAVGADQSAFIALETVDDVTLASTTQVTGINWSGVYVSPLGADGLVSTADDDFTIQVYADVGGAPAETALASFDVGSDVNRTSGSVLTLPLAPDPGGGGFVDGDFQSFNYSADIDFTFDSGTTFWLSILNNTENATDSFSLGVIEDGGNSFGRAAPFPFSPQGFVTDFQLTTSTVPEPGSFTAFTFGLLGLLVRRKRRVA